MVDAREKRDPWTIFLHESASDDTASAGTTSGESLSAKLSAGISETIPGLNALFTARCTTTLSSKRMQDNIRSRNAGATFQSDEIGRSGPPFWSG
jgi:hypothetical protein